MSHVRDDRARAIGDMRERLARLTDAQVQALLALDADAVAYLRSVIRVPGIRWGREEWRRALMDARCLRTDFEHGDDALPLGLVLDEAQRIADGLTARQAASLAATERHLDGDVILARSAEHDIVQLGLAEQMHDALFTTPLGKLVLALRERGKAGDR